jgi:hypothetical protein
LRDGLAPWNASDVGAENNLYARVQRFGKRYFMHGYALSITLAFGSVRWSPIVVVSAQSWTVPGSLLEPCFSTDLPHIRQRP